ncbi:LOW QUALITY PROTEIN: NEDD8-conjugating enzyme Ubc12 [Falco peregrinus]|uniref:LOW QUALITY PROTEIN: NEDD8-conjugating enzyme Ubc12 n=1 Tax=Falco peregrinus TaxID=8954 RepID=UPI00247B0CD3|nr:LOW QUALITY PROTEIN: NEDD8-conjugating enzyme Ubc12 [Falco peregrinus]
MIKLFSLKQQKKEEESAGGTKGTSKKASAAQLRIQKGDRGPGDPPPHPVGQGYPHDPPKVKCETMVYHPNIDLEGNVCLNILREDWKPVLTINSIIYGLQYLFLEPNPEDPLNKEAAEVLQSNRRLFEQNVQRSLRGGYVGATYFERLPQVAPPSPPLPPSPPFPRPPLFIAPPGAGGGGPPPSFFCPPPPPFPGLRCSCWVIKGRQVTSGGDQSGGGFTG